MGRKHEDFGYPFSGVGWKFGQRILIKTASIAFEFRHIFGSVSFIFKESGTSGSPSGAQMATLASRDPPAEGWGSGGRGFQRTLGK